MKIAIIIILSAILFILLILAAGFYGFYIVFVKEDPDEEWEPVEGGEDEGSKTAYVCADCGTKEEFSPGDANRDKWIILFGDLYCPSCRARYNQDHTAVGEVPNPPSDKLEK